MTESRNYVEKVDVEEVEVWLELLNSALNWLCEAAIAQRRTVTGMYSLGRLFESVQITVIKASDL